MFFAHSLVCIHSCVSTFNLLAYIDPSTGSLVFQAIAASLISGALFIRAVRDRIVWLITGGWRASQRSKTTVSSDAPHDSNDGASQETSRQAA